MKIGITGSIGTGKSTVSNYLKSKGYTVISCDDISHNLIKKNGECYQKVIDAFGKEILDENNNISRQKLGKIVYSNINKKEILEKIIHPVVIKKIKDVEGDAFIETPLLFEAHMEYLYDAIIVVYTSCQKQIERIVKRDNKQIDEVKQIINLQMSQEEKKKRADFLIANEKLEDTYTQIDNILKTIFS